MESVTGPSPDAGRERGSGVGRGAVTRGHSALGASCLVAP